MIQRFLLLSILQLTFVSATSCTGHLSPKAESLIETTRDRVLECKYLGIVQGRSGWGMAMAEVGRRNAKIEAMEQAASLGATHVVWEEPSRNVWSPTSWGTRTSAPTGERSDEIRTPV